MASGPGSRCRSMGNNITKVCKNVWRREREGLKTEVAQIGSPPCTYTPHTPHTHTEPAFARRDYLGVHTQKQAGQSWVGLHVPVGRFRAFEIHELGRLAEQYSGGEMRLTVEQNVIFPNVKDEEVAALLADPFVAGGRFKVNPGK